jgi:hypothetical protein
VNRQGATSLRKSLLTSKCGGWSRCAKPNLVENGRGVCGSVAKKSLWGIMPVLPVFNTQFWTYFQWFWFFFRSIFAYFIAMDFTFLAFIFSANFP